MPTKHHRLALTADPELDAAIDAAAREIGGGRPRAAIARELILRGAQAVLEESPRSDLDRYLDERGAIRATMSHEEAFVLAREIRESIPPGGPSSAEIIDELREDRI